MKGNINERISKYRYNNFIKMKHIDKIGNEYWKSRELMLVLKYCKWENFKKVIEKAQISYRVSGNNVCDCFADVGKSIISGKGSVKLL